MPFARFRAFQIWNQNSLVCLAMGVLLGAFSVSSAHSAEVKLAWNASSSGNVAGYYVVWGLSSGNYSGQADVGNKTSHTVTGLVENTTYYFATKAYDSGKTTESALSGDVSTKTPYNPPTANFTATNRSGTAPFTVTFNDTSSGFVSNRSWDFGNNDTSTGTMAVYTYTTPGTYTVSLNVTGPGGEDTETKSAYVVVQAPSGDSGGDGGSTDGGSGGGTGGSGNGMAYVELHLDEGSGSTAYDSSGAGNNGTLRNGASFRTDTGDGSSHSVRLDGTNDYIDLGPLDVNDSGLTLAAWFNADGFPNGDPRLISKASGTAADQHVFMLSTTKVDSENRLRARVRVGGTTKTLIASSGNLSTGSWLHAAATYDGTKLRLYLDGAEVGSTALSGAVDVDPGMSVAVGAQPPGAGGRFFDGFMDDVRIYSRALSKAEIEAISSPSAGTGGGTGDSDSGSTGGETGDSDSGSSGGSGGDAASFQQSNGADGLVLIELEDYDAKLAQNAHDWSTVSRSGASGGKAVEATPNTGFNVNTGYVELSPRLDYSIEFVKTGTHYVWVRGLGSSSSNDSLHVGLDGSPVSTADRISSFNTSWTWSKDTMDGAVARITVPSTGVHTLNVWMREDGMVADRLVLTTNSGYDPDGSTQSGGSTGDGGSTGSGSAGQPAIRINAGGGNYTDSNNKLWQADTGYNTGNTASTSTAIANTGDDALYQTERWDASGGAELRYDLTVAPGSYDLKLHFAEIWSGAFSDGARVFDVRVEGKTVLNRLDVYASANGPNKALIKTLPVTVNDNTLSIELIHRTQNPKISAIEVVPASGGGN